VRWAPLLHGLSVVLPGESLSAAEFTVPALVAIAYLSVLASAVGYLIYFDLLDRLGAIEINLVSTPRRCSRLPSGGCC